MGRWAEGCCCPQGRIQYQLCTNAFSEHLTRSGTVAKTQHPFAAEMHARHTQPLGDVLHHQFGAEQGLGCAEAAKGAIGWRVRRNRAGADADVGTGVGSAGVDRGTREHHGCQRAVAAAVEHDVDILK